MGQILRDEKITVLTKDTASTLSLPSGAFINIGGGQFITESDLTLDTSVSGFGGIDTGSIASATLYYVYAVDSSGVAGLTASLSSTTPTGFSGFRKVGAFHTKGSGTDIHKVFFFSEINNLTYSASYDSSPATIHSQSPFGSGWAASILRNSAGNVTITFGTDIFSVVPAGTHGGGGGYQTTTVTLVDIRNHHGNAAGSGLDIDPGSVHVVKQGIDAIQPDWSL